MNRRTRQLLMVELSLPALAFYLLMIYPFDLAANRGFGWMLLLVMFALSALCIVCALICAALLFKDQKRIVWLVLLLINLAPAFQTFLPQFFV